MKVEVKIDIKQGNEWTVQGETKEFNTECRGRIKGYYKTLLNKRIKEGTIQQYGNILIKEL